jgi:hypothetical protein
LAAENQPRASNISGGELLTRGVFAAAVRALPDADVALGLAEIRGFMFEDHAASSAQGRTSATVRASFSTGRSANG